MSDFGFLLHFNVQNTHISHTKWYVFDFNSNGIPLCCWSKCAFNNIVSMQKWITRINQQTWTRWTWYNMLALNTKSIFIECHSNRRVCCENWKGNYNKIFLTAWHVMQHADTWTNQTVSFFFLISSSLWDRDYFNAYGYGHIYKRFNYVT